MTLRIGKDRENTTAVTKLDPLDKIIHRMRDELQRQRLSQKQLADRAKLSASTVYRALRGDFSDKTLKSIEKALNAQFSQEKIANEKFSDRTYGAYSREVYSHYEGYYKCIRPLFTKDDQVIVYYMHTYWSEEENCFLFSEINDSYSHSGKIFIPPNVPFLHFLTCETGSLRLITACHLPGNLNILRGIVLTLAHPSRMDFLPAAAEILMFKEPKAKPRQPQTLHVNSPALEGVLPYFTSSPQKILVSP